MSASGETATPHGPALDFRAERDAALLELEGNKRPDVRADAADRLCELAARLPKQLAAELEPAMVRMLSDAQPEVRCAALALASQILNDDEALQFFSRHLGEPLVRLRIEAVGRLADLALPEARGALAGALEDESLAVRFEAARGMAALKHPAGLNVLLDALDDAELRFRAAGALAELAHPDSLVRLKQAFHRWFVPHFDRSQIAAALAKLKDSEGVEHLVTRARKRWAVDRPMALELLGEVGAPQARELLEKVLRDKNDLCRGSAARGLGRLKDEQVFPVLASALDEPGLEDEEKLDLAEGLCFLGGDRAREKLETVTVKSDEARAELSAMLKELQRSG